MPQCEVDSETLIKLHKDNMRLDAVETELLIKKETLVDENLELKKRLREAEELQNSFRTVIRGGWCEQCVRELDRRLSSVNNARLLRKMLKVKVGEEKKKKKRSKKQRRKKSKRRKKTKRRRKSKRR